MTVFDDLIRHDVFTFPDGNYRFEAEMPGDLLLFEDINTRKSYTLSEARLEELWARGQAKRHIGPVEMPVRRLKDPDVVPIDVNPRKLLRARTMQFYVRQYDADPLMTTRGVVGIRRFLQGIKAEAMKRELTADIQPAAFVTALKTRGVPGWRPLTLFISQTGLYDRLTKYPDRARILRHTVDLYWSRRTITPTLAFSFFRTEMAKINRKRKSKGLEPIPVPRKMTSVSEAIDAAECWETWKTKYSVREADARYRGVAEAMRAEKVGELVIIDHTVLDSHVMLDTESGIPLGRPTLTVAIDVHSRAILAYLISPEPPSLYSVVCILKLINQPKTHYHDRFPDIAYKWNSRAKPMTVLVDNGVEFLTPSFQESLLDAGIEVLHAPIANGPFKAYGERFFGTLNDLAVHHLAGAVTRPARELAKEGIDPSKEKLLSFDQVDELMYEAVGIYEQREHSGLQGKTPASLFAAGLRRDGRKMIDDPAMLDHLIGNVDDVVISKDGITFRHCQFHDTEITSYILNAMARHMPKRKRAEKGHGARAKVKIKSNPADCSSVSVYLPSEDGNVYVSLPNRNRAKCGLSFWHIEQVVNFANRHNRNIETEDGMHEAIDGLRRKSEAYAQLGKGTSARTAGRVLGQKHGQLAAGKVVEAPLDADPYDIAVEAFAAERIDAERRPAGIRPGIAKAARTRKKNDKARAVIASFDAPAESPPALRSTEPLGFDFKKLAGQFK
jgi:putative transposase